MCADVRPLLPDWAAGQLAPADRRAVDAHLRFCAGCRAEADGWTALSHATAAFVTAAGPPPAWRSPLVADRAVPAAASESAPPPGRQAVHPNASPRQRAAIALAAIAAAVALAALGGDRLRRALVRDGGTAANLTSIRPPILPIQPLPTIVVRMPTRVARLVMDAPRPPLAIATLATRPAVPASLAGNSLAARASAERALSSSQTSHALPTAAEPATAPSDPAPSIGAAPTSASSSRPAPASPAAPASPQAPLSTPIPATSPSVPPPAPPTVPAPPPGAAIVTGIVTGPDGFERAEVNIIALPFDSSEAPHTASTGATGAFTLTLPAGRWSIHAESPAYLPAWPDGAITPLDSAPLDIAAGATARVRFTLAAASWGAIRGRVVDTAGVPVDGALVLAAAPDKERGGYSAFVAATFADADGRYALAVDEGGWLVAAAMDWRAPQLTWWGGDGDLVAVDRVAVSRERAADGIDIRLREAGAD